MKKLLKITLPAGVVLASILFAAILVMSKPDVETDPVKVTPKLIRALEMKKEKVRMTVTTQGTVVPRTETVLVSQAAGLVTEISPAFVAGGFFEKGDILISIDRRDYELALTQAKLSVAQAELRLKTEEQEGKIARLEWKRLNEGFAPPLVAREPQLLEAKATLEAAKAGFQQAKINLERTQIRAPYAGRVRIKNVDVGQYLTPGMSTATIYAVDYAEVRLPLPDDKLAFLDIPVNLRKSLSSDNGPEIILRARFAGKEHEWKGYLSRIEGEIDARSRMIHVVARVKDPYRIKMNSNRPPLTVGMFVNAEIIGKEIDNVIIIPRSALRDNNRVLVIDEKNRLRFRPVNVVRIESENVYVDSGLEDGERICISPIQAVVDGMPVTIFSENK